MENPDYITVKEGCAIVGGSKPISVPTWYRNPELKALIEHPSRGISRVSRPKLLKLMASRSPEAA